MEETLETETQLVQVAPATNVAGWLVTTATRAWRLNYAITDSATCNSMAAFYDAQFGAAYAFQLFNPNDGQLHTVRFDSPLSIQLFQPGMLRVSEVRLVAVNS